MAHPHLLEPFAAGGLTLPHRVVMAPLTRNRAVGTVPAEVNALYYAQRASAAILITEGTHPAAVGQGYLDIAGLHTDEQQEGWAKVVAAVRAAGHAKLVIQLMHCGRVAHPVFTDGETPVAPSAIRHEGQVFTGTEELAYVEPRALETDELPGVIEDYVQAARRAVAAGADGIELHAANGYLLHQFLAESTNHRTDGYGTDVEGRVRFPLEVVAAVCAAIGAPRVAIRISPGHEFNGIVEQDPRATYDRLLAGLAEHPLMYLHVMETQPYAGYSTIEQARGIWKGPLMGNAAFTEEFDVDGADEHVGAADFDLVAFGRRFLANPDLPLRLQLGAPLNAPDDRTFYSRGPQGYVDYPILSQEVPAPVT